LHPLLSEVNYDDDDDDGDVEEMMIGLIDGQFPTRVRVL
jgi:hypothetical protein